MMDIEAGTTGIDDDDVAGLRGHVTSIPTTPAKRQHDGHEATNRAEVGQ